MFHFGEHIRVLSTPETEELRIAGLDGQVIDTKHLSFINVDVIGDTNTDIAVDVYFDDISEDFWLTPDLLEHNDPQVPWWKFWSSWSKKSDRQRIEDLISKVANSVQELIDTDLAKVNREPSPEHPLSQAGLRDGNQIVIDYSNHGEYGLALEHILYMIEEPELSISDGLRGQILQLSDELDIKGIHTRFE